MSQQAMPFFDSAKAATKYAIQASGKTAKEVAHALWPNKTIERAQTDLLNALNENRESELSTEEHLFIAMFCNQFDWLYYACHRAEHARPVRQSPEDQQAQIQAAILETADRFEALMKQFRQQVPSRPARATAR